MHSNEIIHSTDQLEYIIVIFQIFSEKYRCQPNTSSIVISNNTASQPTNASFHVEIFYIKSQLFVKLV